MKRLLPLLLMIACTLVSGCVKYRVVLNSGETFTVLGKPKYDPVYRVYRYKAGGEEQIISAGRVVAIEPTSDISNPNPQASGF